MFTGFTSTSCEESKALAFAYQATKKEGQVPVLFVMDTNHDGGYRKAYLHDNTLSAFPGEQEYLIGATSWMVQDIKPKVLKEYNSETFEVTEV